MKTHVRVFLLLVSVFFWSLHNGVAGSSSFNLTNTLPVGNGPTSIAVADVNGDGYPDLISADTGGTTLTVLTNNGLGEFGLFSTISLATNAISVAAADLNGDGHPDLVCAYLFSALGGGNTLTVWTNNGAGGFGSNSTLEAGFGTYFVTAAALHGGSNLDLVCANSDLQYGNNLTVLTNNGHGVFPHSANYGVGAGPVSVAVADVNGDGRPDLISANSGDGTLTVLTNEGNSIFAFMSTIPVGSGSGSAPYSVVAVDVNGDGKPDLISANANDSTLSVLTNNGNGRFTLAATLTVDQTPLCVAAADVNGDGKPDLICANYDSSTLTVLTNSGGGQFGFYTTLNTGVNPQFVVAADVTGFGLPDLVSANSSDVTLSLFYDAPYPPKFSGISKTAAQNVTVSWLVPTNGFVLQQSTNLATGNWSSYPGTVSDDGVIRGATTNTSASQLFFRLSHP
jgi:hypothetical protein